MILDNNVYDMSENTIIEYANKLADAIECNQFLEEYNSGRLSYEYLIAMFLATQAMENGDKLYNYCYDAVIACGKRNIDFKLKQNKKIKVAFLPISAAEWPAEYIYRKLETDTRFEPEVIPVPLIGRPKKERGKVYMQTYDFFANGNYNVKKVYNAETEEIVGWEDIGGMPDIVVHVTPWYLNIAKDYQVGQYPLHVLNVYISYGVTLGNSIDGTYAEKCLYNKEFVNIMWKVYTETTTNYECYKKYQVLKAKNVINSGYIKMDYFVEKHQYSDDYIRKIWPFPSSSDIKSYKRVLITPHFSVGNTNILSFSTFDKNMYFYIYLAKKYRDNVSFIFKPHPNLRNGLIENGYMKSVDEYEAYLDEFRKLPNASVCEEGDYLALFDTSDGIINDSISFIGEYLYVDKPMLFLERPEQCFDELGRTLIKAHYKACGEDYMGIDNFVNDVVINENDYMKQQREEIFSEELDYYSKNGIKASEYVYKDIVDGVFRL